MEFMEKKMSVFVNGLFVGSEIYPGVYAEALAGPSWMIRKENAQGSHAVSARSRGVRTPLSFWPAHVWVM